MSRVSLVPKFTIKPNQMDAFMTAVLRQRDNCLKLESGCEHFDVLRIEEAPNEVLLYEVYTDQAAINAHRETPHYAQFKSDISELVETLDLKVWDIVE